MTTLDPIFGIHAQALAVQSKRMEVLSSNIANADTPNYQAREVDFASVLAGTANTAAAGPAMLTTDPRHIAPSRSEDESSLVYRIARQPSTDHNTVDVQVEQAKFADAALHYQASLTFASGQVSQLITALTGS